MEQKKRKRIILMGRSAAGKTTLCQCINHEDLHYHKTQTVQVVNQSIIDTPGEYVQGLYFRGCLMVSAVDADIVVFVQAADDDMTWFPPGYSSQFGKPAVGVVTKADLATEEQIKTAKKYLKMAGASEIFVTSSVSGEGVDEFLKFLGYV